MNANVLFLSTRYIRYEYCGALLSVMDIKKIYSFLPLNSMMYSTADAIRRYSHAEIDCSGISEEDYLSFVNRIASEIASYVTSVAIEDEGPNTGRLEHPFYIVIADWEDYYGYKPYNQILSETGQKFKRWSARYNPFPYTCNYGSLDDQLKDATFELLGSDELLRKIRFYKTSVYFSPEISLSQRYDYDKEEWNSVCWRSRNTGKSISLVRNLTLKAAKKNEQTLVYTNDEGRRLIHHVVLDVALREAKEYVREQAEREYRRQWAQEEYDAEQERQDREDMIRDGLMEAFNGDMSNMWNID